MLTVIYDGDCGICNRIRRWCARLDFTGALTWTAYQTGIGVQWRLPNELLRERIYLVGGKRILSGFRASKRILLYLPVTYIAAGLLIWAAPYVFAPLILAFFFPPFEPIGEAVYNWVARNRYRLSGDSCEVDVKR